MATNDRVRIAAVSDLHYTKGCKGICQEIFIRASEQADVLLLCGDLTNYGLPEEAQVLADDMQSHSRIPVIAVWGNHDFESARTAEVQEILEKVHKPGQGNIETARVGTVAYNRGVLTGVLITEAFRIALREYGAPLTGQKVRDGLNHVKLDGARLRQLGAEGLMPELIFSEDYHGGMDPQLFQKWDAKKWTTISDWVKPYEDVVRAEIKKSAREYVEKAKK